MHDMIQQSINLLVFFGLFSSPQVAAAPATTSALGSKSGSQSTTNLTCGKTGWDSSQESFLSTGYCNSWAYCQSACELHSDCQSFAYFNGASGDTGGDCELYSVPVQGNFVADSSSTYKFYDKSCMAAEKQCNVKGYSRIDSFTGINANSISDCATVCSGYNDHSTGCVSYAFGEGTCLLYSYLVVDNVDIDSTSDFIFNDALCGQFASTVITSTTTTKNTGKTTTTAKVTSSTKTSSTMTTTRSSSATKSITTTKASSMTMTTTTAISTAVASNSPHCGVAGWYRTDSISESSVDSLSSCGQFCYGFTGGSSNCLAYAYSDEGICRLYSSSVADSVWVTSTSEFKNYDLACYNSAATITTTSKAGRTTTTTTVRISTTTTKTTTTKKSSQTTTTISIKKSTSKSTATATTTSTTSDPAATTTTSSTAQAQCGVVGWGRASAFFDYVGDTLQECAQACFNNRDAPNNCLSYGYGYTGHECRLYSNVSVADNVYVNPASDFGNYDLPCYNASLNLDPSICTPGYHNAQCNYKLDYSQDARGSFILNSFDDCVISCNSITNCRHVVWYRQAAEGVPQNTCVVVGNTSGGGMALDGVDSANRF